MIDTEAEACAALCAIGFAGDLGPAWTRELSDRTTIVVSGIDANGEPDKPRIDGPAWVQRLADPMDWSTLIECADCRTFADALATIGRWCAEAQHIQPTESG